MKQTCPICQSAAEVVALDTTFLQIRCAKCDCFKITQSAIGDCSTSNPKFVRYLASAYIRANQGITVDVDVIDGFAGLKVKSVSERARILLQHLYFQHPGAGEMFDFPLNDAPALIAITWSEQWSEVRYLFTRVLRDGGFLEHANPPYSHSRIPGGIITPAGHELIDSLKVSAPGASKSAFCAMWFNPRLEVVYINAIAPAIEAAGYEAVQIDRVQHINKVDDEIVARIRTSRLLVADLTGTRGGVYYEAGFAAALGIPVFLTVREKRRHKVHFDIRQFNCIGWDPDALPAFTNALRLRIEALIGRGPSIKVTPPPPGRPAPAS